MIIMLAVEDITGVPGINSEEIDFQQAVINCLLQLLLKFISH